jgi:hypothetical protein
MNTHHPTHRSSAAVVALGALAITAASLLVEVAPGQDVTFPLFMLGGPLLTGAILAGRGHRWPLGAAAWSLAALTWLAADWAINGEDIAFHALIAAIFAALVALGASLQHAARRMRARSKRADPLAQTRAAGL